MKLATGGTLILADAIRFVRDAADVSATEIIVDNDSSARRWSAFGTP